MNSNHKWIKTIGSAWIFLSILSLIFTYNINPIQPALYSKLLGLQMIATLTLLGLVFGFIQSVYIPKQKGVLLYLVFILSLIPSCIYAINPGKAWSEYAKIISFFLIFTMAYGLFSIADFKKIFTRSIIVFVLLSLVVGAFQLSFLYFNFYSEEALILVQNWFGALPDSLDLHQKSYFIKSTFAHRNLFAQLVLLSMPFLLYSSIKEKGFWKYLAILTLVAACIPIVMLFVRTIWLIAFVVLIISGALWLISGGVKYLNLRNSLIAFVFVAVLSGGVFLLIKKNKSINETFVKQGYWLNDQSFGSVQERLVMWKATLPMIQENSLFGVGAGNWATAFPNYYHQEVRKSKNGMYYQFQRPHNDYLQMMAEYGLIPFLLFFVFILLALVKLIKVFFKERDFDKKLWTFSLLIFLLTYAGISMFSYPKERIEHNLLLTFVLAFAYTITPSSTLTNQWKLSFPRIIILILVLTFGALSYHSYIMYKSDEQVKKAYQERALGSQKQYKHFKKAKNYFYNTDPNGTPLAWYQSFQYASTGNLIMAERFLKESLKAHPYHKNTFNDLGSVKYQLGKMKDAQTYYSRALEISPTYVEANVNMAVTYIQMANFDTAWYFISQCDTINYYSKNYRSVYNECTRYIAVPFVAKLQFEDPLLAKTIERIMIDDKWMWTTHKHAIDNNRTFRQQLVEEAVYVLLEIEMKIELKHAQAIREKYNIHLAY